VGTLTSIPPTIGVVKTADPLTRPEPGGDFTFTVVVTNPSTFKDLTITSLVDDIYGDLNGKGTCVTGTVLAPGQSYTCEFTGEFRGNAGDRQTDTVTATGRDNQGREVSATAKATVSLTPVPVPPVVNPPPPPPPPPVVQRPLPRTGFSLGGPGRMAIALILVGSLMILGTLRRNSPRPALAVPSGLASSLDNRRRSGAQRSAQRLSVQMHRTKHSGSRWAGAKPSRLNSRLRNSEWMAEWNRFLGS